MRVSVLSVSVYYKLLVIFSEILYKLHTIDEIKEQLDEVDEDIKTLDDQVAYFPIIIISNSTNLNF